MCIQNASASRMEHMKQSVKIEAFSMNLIYRQLLNDTWAVVVNLLHLDSFVVILAHPSNFCGKQGEMEIDEGGKSGQFYMRKRLIWNFWVMRIMSGFLICCKSGFFFLLLAASSSAVFGFFLLPSSGFLSYAAGDFFFLWRLLPLPSTDFAVELFSPSFPLIVYQGFLKKETKSNFHVFHERKVRSNEIETIKIISITFIKLKMYWGWPPNVVTEMHSLSCGNCCLRPPR